MTVPKSTLRLGTTPNFTTQQIKFYKNEHHNTAPNFTIPRRASQFLALRNRR